MGGALAVGAVTVYSAESVSCSFSCKMVYDAEVPLVTKCFYDLCDMVYDMITFVLIKKLNMVRIYVGIFDICQHVTWHIWEYASM